MQVTIDNLSGTGPVDYTGSIEASKSVHIKRTLNAPSECSFAFLPDAQGLPMPARYARVSVMDTAAVVLFTGYVVTVPAMALLGEGFADASYEALVTAISDEVLLDSLLSVSAGTALKQPAAEAMQTLARLAGTATLTVNTQVSSAVGRYSVGPATQWSKGAGAIAASVRSAYRVVAGVTTLAPVGTVVHTLNETDGSLQLSALKAATVKLLANDVTVCGKIEPAAYVTETFQGDGVTKDFTLSDLPFAPTAAETLKLADLFQGASLNGQVWQSVDSGSRISITANGLTCTGGSGRDGETVVSAIQQLELGGSILLEASGVAIGGQGLLLGLYEGAVITSNCFAGFEISGAGGVTKINACINGSVGGSSFTPITGHIYTLRMRVYSAEMERVQQSYYYLDGNGINSYGGGVVVAPGYLEMEIQDGTSGAAGLPVVIYSGSTTVLPPACTLGLLNSGALVCSVKTFTCTQGAPSWVVATPTNGTAAPLFVGTTAEGGSCKLTSAGKLSFYSGTIPAAGTLIAVSYRTRHRAVARRSIPQPGAQAGATPLAPTTQMWVGTVTEPPAWSSVDCDNAAAALLQSSAVAAAAWAGTYTGWNADATGDVWPGDVLAIASVSAGMDAAVVVREVDIEMGSASPQMVKYVVRFANDWAEELALKLSTTVPEDAWLPVSPPSGGAPLANLATLQVTAITGAQINVSAGVSAPPGGGFEVRRKDWMFGPGVDSDLVLRSPVSNFIIPRVSAVEQYYVRMYDGATPPNYSQLSAGVFADVPLTAG